MPGIDVRPFKVLCKWLAIVCCSVGPVHAQSFFRILDAVDLTAGETHRDLNLQFNCQVRYLAHDPANEGDSLRVRLTLGSDCETGATLRSETAASPDPAVVSAVELNPLLGNEVELLIRWRRVEQFLVAPAQQRSLRIRLLRADPGVQGKVMITEPNETVPATGYALNLDSSLHPFDANAVAQAQTMFGIRTYVSEAVIDDVRWYRLRVGPISTRAAAENALRIAQQSYSKVWLAIADEEVADSAMQTLPDSKTVESEAQAAAANAAINDPEADALWTTAREQFRGKHYDAAIETLTKLLARASRKHRADAQELLGLARERSRQLAHAKAEYEKFLREFPNHSHSNRVRRRLNALRTAALVEKNPTGAGADDALEGNWKLYGGFSQMYRRDNSQITVDADSRTFTSQNALLNDVDLIARKRGFDFDTRARVSAGFIKDFLSNGPGDQVRVSSAFVELADRDRSWFAAVGRQSRTSGGLLGTFDGAIASYQFLPHFILDGAVGFPVDTSRSGVKTNRRFESLAANFGNFANAWEPTLYVVNQTLDGYTDRQAVGAELRYFRPGRSLIGFVDYDVHFQTLNSAVLVGTMQWPARWTVNVDLERRNSPLISTRNALIGQTVFKLDDLSTLYTAEEIKQLALDRTPITDVYSLSVAHPIGERLQLTLTGQSVTTGDTPPSGNVEGIPKVGPELSLSAQLLAASIMRAGDIHILGLRHQSGGLVRTDSMGWTSRLPFWNVWRIGPQLRVDRRLIEQDGSTQWVYVPGLKLTLQRRRLQAEFEVGAELSNRDTAVSQQDTKRYFLSLGYRWYFQ